MKGKTAIVTGASSGIGRATAVKFAERGATVVVADVDAEGGIEVAEACSALSPSSLFRDHDVAQEDSWIELIEAVTDAFGGVDILVNNAGVALGGPLVDTTIEDWRWVMGI
ncbi:MAG: SDR family NAD(P)-dependent oxidoreductase, partial [Rhodospirillaceae bacterium]|nr:SDR family NAD(P)-dependent oxidoreductase [Rhodospirillaceae bacterium]